jgi:hypothetical protein
MVFRHFRRRCETGWPDWSNRAISLVGQFLENYWNNPDSWANFFNEKYNVIALKRFGLGNVHFWWIFSWNIWSPWRERKRISCSFFPVRNEITITPPIFWENSFVSKIGEAIFVRKLTKDFFELSDRTKFFILCMYKFVEKAVSI